MTIPTDERHSHSRWKLASQISGLGIWEYSIDEEIRFFSDEWFFMRGRKPLSDFQQVPKFQSWIERVHIDDRARALEITAKFHDGTLPSINYEHRELHSNGYYIWILSRGRAIEWNVDGTPQRFLGTDTDITSIKAAEDANEELRENQIRYRVAIENASVGVWDNDRETGNSFKSDGWKTMRGHSADSSYGSAASHWQKDIHPEDTENLLLREEVMPSGQSSNTLSTQYRQRRKDGSWMWVLSRGHVVARDQTGAPLRTIGVDTDITEVKDKEAILGRVSKTLELAVSASQMGVWESFSESGDAVWDKRTREIFGLTSHSDLIPPDEFKSFVHPEDIPIVEHACDAPASRGEDFAVRYRIVHPEKGVRHVNVQAVFHQTHELGPRHVGIIFDVTGRVEREAALTQTNKLLDGVLQQMEQGIAMFQGPNLQSSRIVLSNEKFYELLEISPPTDGSQLSFQQYRTHIDPFLQWPQNRFNNLDEVVEAAEDGTRLNTLLRLPSGRVISVTGIGHGDGTRIMTFTDMSALFSSERRREELADNISHLERLQALGKLTGGVAHDFNNLLTVIIGNAELIQEGFGDNAECLSAIVKAANRGADLTQRLLAFSRKQPLQPTAIETDRLLNTVKELLGRTLGETIEIETEFGPDIWGVHADLGQLENALINLAVNARDAMPQGGILRIKATNQTIGTAEARHHDELQPGDYVRFSVTDQGAGMDVETLEKAFDPFFTTKDVGQGSGLGLSMVFGFIKQSNGDVTITSRPEHGTSVDFLLPRCAPENTAHPTPPPTAPQDGQQQTVLLVEDDANVRRMVEVALNRMNYLVVSYNDAIEALNALSDRALTPDLVVSDVALPGGMNGFEFGERFSRIQPKTKILYISGYSENLLPLHGLEPKSLEFLRKPFTMQEFSDRISAILAT